MLPVRLPSAPPAIRNKRVLPVAFAAAAVVLFFLGPTWRTAATNSITGAIVCLSLVVLTGFAGQISLAQMAFAGISGFALAKLAVHLLLPFPVGLVLGASVATIFGVVFSLPALRIRGVHLAIVTLAAAVTVADFVFANPTWTGLGGAPVPAPHLFGLQIAPSAPYNFGDHQFPNPLFGIACLVVLLVMVLIVSNVRRSQLGSHMLAVRANERAAAAVGINAVHTKIIAFTLAAFIAGIGGALEGYASGVVTSDEFGATTLILIFAFAYLGGISSIGGALIASLFVPSGILTSAAQHIGISANYLVLLGGLGVIINAVQAPEGIAGAVGHIPQAVADHTRKLRTRRPRTPQGPAHPHQPIPTGPVADPRSSADTEGAPNERG